MTLHDNLKHLRESRKLSQRKLGEVLQIKTGTIGSYEEKRATPGVKVLCKYSDFFNVTIDELIKKDLKTKTEE